MSLLRWMRSANLLPRLIGTTKLSRWMTYCSAQSYYLTNAAEKANCKLTKKQCTRNLGTVPHQPSSAPNDNPGGAKANKHFMGEAISDGIKKSITFAVQITLASLALYGLSYLWHKKSDMNKKVMEKFENPDLAALVREGYHFPREEEVEIEKAFLNQTDTLGLVGVVFGPAGTGKSNVVRTVCKEAGAKAGTEAKAGAQKSKGGVIYMEIGSPRQFPYHLAKACGVPIEPTWYDTVVTKLFAEWKTHITLPESRDEDALALVLPVIAKGGEEYKEKHDCVPVLFIDGIDILAKQEDKKLYLNLVDWAKKCANEDSLRIVFVCSDSHVLALDQQSFKSRLDDLIEINDVNETKAMKLMKDKYGFSDNLARSIFSIIGGRLADIHKVVAIWKKKIAELVDVPEVVVSENVANYVNSTPLEQIQMNTLPTLDSSGVGEDKSDTIQDKSKRKLIRNIIRTINFRNCWKTYNVKTVVIPQEVIDAVSTAPQDLQTILFNMMKGRIQNATCNEDECAAMKKRICTIIPLEVVNVLMLKIQNSDEAQTTQVIKEYLLDIIGTYDFSKAIEEQFKREMRQALCNALVDKDKDNHEIKEHVIRQVLGGTKTVEDIAYSYVHSKKSTQLQEVKDAIQTFLSHNVLRITKYRTLCPYSKIAQEVLTEHFRDRTTGDPEQATSTEHPGGKNRDFIAIWTILAGQK